MDSSFTRRQWLHTASVGVGAAVLHVPTAAAQTPAATDKPPSGPSGAAPGKDAAQDWLSSFPRQPLNLVQEVVGASHARIDRVRELVTAYPELAKASWDWGFGDWETPIGAASHTGNREIVALLMDHGAVPTIFTHAMLGDLEIVKSMLDAQPRLLQTPGPHTLSLLHHAKASGENAALVEYLRSHGAKDTASAEATKDQVDTLSGAYQVTDGPKLWIEAFQGGLAIRDEAGSKRRLFPLADHAWHPAGAASVRVRFEPKSGTPAEMILSMGGKTIRGRRS